MIYRTKSDGNIYKELRKKTSLTQNEVALKLAIARTAISKWERGETIPDQKMLPKIAELYGTTIDYLLTGKECINPIISPVKKEEKPYIVKLFECMDKLGQKQLTDYAEGILINTYHSFDIEEILKNNLEKENY